MSYILSRSISVGYFCIIFLFIFDTSFSYCIPNRKLRRALLTLVIIATPIRLSQRTLNTCFQRAVP
jgi:hypothetical protein